MKELKGCLSIFFSESSFKEIVIDFCYTIGPVSQVVAPETCADTIREYADSSSFCLKYQEDCKEVLYTIERICKSAVYSSELWKDEKKILGKRRALFDMLKLLDCSGLSKHRSSFLEVFICFDNSRIL